MLESVVPAVPSLLLCPLGEHFYLPAAEHRVTVVAARFRVRVGSVSLDRRRKVLLTPPGAQRIVAP